MQWRKKATRNTAGHGHSTQQGLRGNGSILFDPYRIDELTLLLYYTASRSYAMDLLLRRACPHLLKCFGIVGCGQLGAISTYRPRHGTKASQHQATSCLSKVTAPRRC